MNRFFTEDIAGNTARITGEDVRHISCVLRLRVGEQIAICDGRANEYIGEITAISEAAKKALRPIRTSWITICHMIVFIF